MGTLDPSWDVTSLVLRFGERADERLLEVVTSGGGKEVEHLLNAILILVGRKPRLLAEMVEGCDPEMERRLLSLVLPWCCARTVCESALNNQVTADVGLVELAVSSLGSGGGVRELSRILKVALEVGHCSADLLQAASAGIPLTDVETRLDEDLMVAVWGPEVFGRVRSLLGRLKDEDRRAVVEEALCLDAVPGMGSAAISVLSVCLDDPRAAERLVSMAGDPDDPLGAHALLALAISGFGPLDSLMAARVRGAEASQVEVLQLRLAAVWASSQTTDVLVRLLRAESPRVASLAAILVAPLKPPLESVAKAMGRHRNSSIERSISPLIWSRWREFQGWLPKGLSSNDREVCLVCVDLAAVKGDYCLGEELLAVLERDQEFLEPVLNALEKSGPLVAPTLRRFVQNRPDLARAFAVGRRLKIIEELEGRLEAHEAA